MHLIVYMESLALPDGWARRMSSTEGIEYYYQTAPVESSISCWIHPSKHYSVYGDEELVDKCIEAFAQDASVHARGSYGSVKKVIVDGIPYFVKRMYEETEPGDKMQVAIRRIYAKHAFVENEIKVALDLTEKIPEYVSNIKAAEITLSPNPVGKGVFYIDAFLIFEAPSGMNLHQYLKVRPPRMHNELYDTVYCMVKNAQVALNNAGYVHRDIKPDNIYVLLDEMDNPTACKLIDFGFTVKKGSVVPRVGTPTYTPKHISNHLWHPLEVSTSQNDYSSDVIWTRDFKRDPASKPKCSLVAESNDFEVDMVGGGKAQSYKSQPNAKKVPGRKSSGARSLRKSSSFKKGGKKTYKKNSKLKQRSRSSRKKL